jgi:hopene-associated glycosyltransferase HpnB
MTFPKNTGLTLAAASLTAWVVLAAFRGRFWAHDADAHLSSMPANGVPPRVEVVVPARNEAETIGRAAASLVAQRYAGPLKITIVDDASTDGTADAARAGLLDETRRLQIVAGRPLAPPWTGKLNALDNGVTVARRERGRPAFWLFTDADIVHHPDNLAELVAKAERDNLDLVSLMVRLHCQSRWERLLVPAFIFFFAKLYPFAWSNDPARKTAAAAGGCVLVRASALERIGGLQSIADRLIDDCALARAVKSSGGTTWIGVTARTSSNREYRTLGPLWHMVRRTAFTQLDESNAQVAIATLAMSLLYLVPPLLTGTGLFKRDPRFAATAGAAWALMAALYLPTIRAYGRPSYEAAFLPVAATIYMAMTVDSAVAHARGFGGAWKGRVVAKHPIAKPEDSVA